MISDKENKFQIINLKEFQNSSSIPPRGIGVNLIAYIMILTFILLIANK